MKTIQLLAMLLTTAALTGCWRGAEAPAILVYHDGNEYEILERGDATDAGEPAYLVRYISADPSAAAVRSKEIADLSAVVAQHIDTNEYRRVVFIAVAEKGGLFGLLKPSQTSESAAVEDVMKHKPVKAEPAE